MADRSNLDVLFSIYQNIQSDKQDTFSFQQVSRKHYYPLEFEFLSNRIENAEGPIEIEKSNEQFNSFLTNRKNELLALFQQSKRREKVNQRRLYLLIDSTGQAIYRQDQEDLIYIAGPLGGGILKLNEDLDEVERDEDLAIVKFDNQDVGHDIDRVIFDSEICEYTLDPNKFNEFTEKTFPIVVNEELFSLKRAINYFEDQYQKLMMVNDFSPIVDSSFIAAEATINANLAYLSQFPEVVNQKFDQYKGSQGIEYPNFLALQNLLNMSIDDQTQLRISGYSFVENGSQYSVKFGEFHDGLNLFIATQTSFNTINKLFNYLITNKDLKWQIEEIQKRDQSLNSINYQSNPVIREIIGIKSIKSRLRKIEQSEKLIEFPIGYVSFRKDGEYQKVVSSFQPNQLPKQLTNNIITIKNAIELVKTGPLDTLTFNGTNVSVYVSHPNADFRIQIREMNKDDFDLVVYIVGFNLEYFRKFAVEQDISFSDSILDTISFPLSRENWDLIKSELGISTSYTLDHSVLNTDYPLRSYIETKLSDHVVPVLLRRILREVEEFEDKFGTDEVIEVDPYSFSLEQDLAEERQEEDQLNSYIKERMKYIENEENIHSQLLKIEDEINHFNPGLYSFLADMLRREKADLTDSIERMYTEIKKLFYDISVAVIDFGLTPSQWKFASNLQLWKSYQAQISYMEHSIIIEIRSIIGQGFEGNDLHRLVNHDFSKGIQQKSFYGNREGGEYLKLKKVHLGFIPKIKTYEGELQQSSNLDELLELLEEFERKRKEKVKSQLPDLPGQL